MVYHMPAMAGLKNKMGLTLDSSVCASAPFEDIGILTVNRPRSIRNTSARLMTFTSFQTHLSSTDKHSANAKRVN